MQGRRLIERKPAQNKASKRPPKATCTISHVETFTSANTSKQTQPSMCNSATNHVHVVNVEAFDITGEDLNRTPMPYEDHSYANIMDGGCARTVGKDFAFHDCSATFELLKIQHLENKLRDMEKEVSKLKERCDAPFISLNSGKCCTHLE
ncbi:hypothetical protein AC249_AIPGENE23925 [Exaiptasia diaphana]|nr:hypothetical protein AC249_AIPGENE23925 [Exaiptasia diaphana]